jgi:lipopolysaccharide biosynthesis regulator YciM
MQSTIKAMLLGIVIAVLAIPAVAQSGSNLDMEILAEKMKADKKLLIAMNMNLTDGEAKNFWPVYDKYQKELQQLNQNIGEVIGEYAEAYNKGPVSNDLSKKLIKEMLAVKAAEVKLMVSVADKLEEVLPTTKVARYIQMENKIRALINYDLAAKIPLIY